MKRLKGFSAVGVIIGVVVAGLIIFAAYKVIDGNNKATNFGEYDFYSIIEGTKDNGEIGDHVKGNPEAPVVIFEYMDPQCSHCASMNARINKIVEELDGKLAVVYRYCLIREFNNNTAAASAAEAAGLQGYWKEYLDKLFSAQAEWFYATPSERTELFSKYFEEATEGKGDLEKFNEDIASEAVSKKISFDMGIAKRIDVSGTPAFYIDGQFIDWGDSDKSGVDSVVVNGRTVTWNGTQSGEDFVKLIKDIVAAKLGE